MFLGVLVVEMNQVGGIVSRMVVGTVEDVPDKRIAGGFDQVQQHRGDQASWKSSSSHDVPFCCTKYSIH